MKNIAEKIRLAKTGNEEAMIEILDICNPMIRKYTRLLNYDEDIKSELVLKVISLVKEEIEYSAPNCASRPDELSTAAA